MSRRDSALQRQPFAPRNSSALPLFYMYDSRELPLYHEELLGCVAAHRRADFFDDQYATGYWMHWQLRAHRARTRRAELASLFVVPLWLQLSWRVGACNGTSHLERVAISLRALNATSSFRRFPRRHLLPASTFMMREPPRSRALARRQVHDALDPRLGCYNPWSGYRHFGFMPKETALELLLDQMTIAHMERPPPIPSTLCEVSLPLTGARMYDEWPPPWWRTRTLVLPYVVDAHATALARASASGAFDYAQWVKRPTTFFFAGNCVRKRGAAYVRLALTQLNAAFADARVHCSGVRETAAHDSQLTESMRTWIDEADRSLAANKHAHDASLASALHGSLALPPLSKSEVVSGMAEAKFCLNPRGDSPSSGRIFYSIALGCIPILISDPWVTMAEPFDGLLPFGDFATFVDEGEAITKTVVALSARLEALGGIATASADALEKQRRRWRFPAAGSAAAVTLAARVEAMGLAHRAALWQLPHNELLANLTLASALRIVEEPEPPAEGLVPLGVAHVKPRVHHDGHGHVNVNVNVHRLLR